VYTPNAYEFVAAQEPCIFVLEPYNSTACQTTFVFRCTGCGKAFHIAAADKVSAYEHLAQLSDSGYPTVTHSVARRKMYEDSTAK